MPFGHISGVQALLTYSQAASAIRGLTRNDVRRMPLFAAEMSSGTRRRSRTVRKARSLTPMVAGSPGCGGECWRHTLDRSDVVPA